MERLNLNGFLLCYLIRGIEDIINQVKFLDIH